MKNDNLLLIFKIFKNRPFHLYHFLVDNDAFSPEFLKKVKENKKLSKLDIDTFDKNLHFNKISEMKEYFNSLVEDFSIIKVSKNKEDLEIELNKQLKNAIDKEDYEEAAIIRDYMIRNNINRNLNFI